MRYLILLTLVLIHYNVTLAGTPPLTLEYCTTDYNGVVSNGSTVLCYGTHGIIARSTDKGNTWQRVSLGSEHNLLRIDTINSVYVALSNTRLFTSTDNAITWKSIPLVGGIDLCHSNDSLYILTRYAILSSTLSALPELTSIVVLDSTLSYRKIIATQKGTLHWIEVEKLVSSYNISTKNLTKADVLSLNQCPTCNRIDGLQSSTNLLFVAIVNSQSHQVTLPDDYYKVYVSGNMGTSWEQFLPLNIPDPLNISNFTALNDSTIIALRRNDVRRKVAIPAPDTLNKSYSLSFLMFEYLMLSRIGKIFALNPSDTIPERYAEGTDQKLQKFMRLDDKNFIGVGNNHCIVRSTNNGATWKLQSYFPQDEGGLFAQWFRSPKDSVLYMPSSQGCVYKTTNAGVTILPQHFNFYPQYINANIAFTHFDSKGKGCVIITTGKEKDSNVFVTNDYGETYTPISNISHFNVFAQDSINRSKYKLINRGITQTVETTNTFLISGTPTYLDSLRNLVAYPYSLIFRLDKNYRLIDTVVIPIPRILAMNVVDNTIYIMGLYLKNLSYKQTPQELEYPVYTMYRSTDEGKTWDSLGVTIPIPKEYRKVGQQYQVLPLLLTPSYLYNKHLIYGAGNTRLLIYSLEQKQFDTLHLPFIHLGGYNRSTMFSFDDKLVTASLNNSIMFTTGLNTDATVWDSTQIGDMIPWDDTHQMLGFTPSTSETGFVNAGEYKGKFIVDIYKTHILQYKPTSTSTAVEEETTKIYLWNTAPFPQPTQGIISTHVFWDFGYTLQDIHYALYDVMGNKITNASMSATPLQQYSATLSVDCSALAKGVYVIHIQLKGSTRIVPIVVF